MYKVIEEIVSKISEVTEKNLWSGALSECLPCSYRYLPAYHVCKKMSSTPTLLVDTVDVAL